MAEISIINCSQLEDTKRVDAEYYHPKYLDVERKVLRTKSYKLWKSIEGQFITGPFGSEFKVENYVEDTPYRYVRGRDVKDFFLLDDDNVYIPKKAFNRLGKYALQDGDILISVVGTLGNTAIVNKDVPPAIFSCKSTAYRTKAINPYYLVAYLNCQYGKNILQRKVRGAVQTGLNIDDLKTLPIFLPDEEVQNQIARIVLSAKRHYDISKSFYTQAETLLLQEFGLGDFELRYKLSYTTNLSEPFGVHRVDAEYFQPAYKTVVSKIMKYPNRYTRLLSCLESVRPDFDPRRYLGKVFPYVELADIDASIGVIYGTSEIKGDEAPSRARRMLRKNDVIVSSVEGSLEKVALVDEQNEGSLASTGFFQFRATKILPEALLVLSKSIALQAQLKKECSGTILTAVPNESLKRILIPIIPDTLQKKIASLINQSHEARRKARDLQEEAKRRVEEQVEKQTK